MRTNNQIEASRSNGAKSKGPVTPEGKARVALNAVQHGLYSKRIVLAGEDPEAWAAMRDRLIRAWEPATAFEHDLVIDIVEARWRLVRFTSLESAAIDFQTSTLTEDIREAWTTIDTGTLHTLAFNELVARNRALEVIQAGLRQQHRIIRGAISQLLQLRKIRPDSNQSASGGRAGTNGPRPDFSVLLTDEEFAAALTSATVKVPSTTEPAQPESPASPPVAAPAHDDRDASVTSTDQIAATAAENRITGNKPETTWHRTPSTPSLHPSETTGAPSTPKNPLRTPARQPSNTPVELPEAA